MNKLTPTFRRTSTAVVSIVIGVTGGISLITIESTLGGTAALFLGMAIVGIGFLLYKVIPTFRRTLTAVVYIVIGVSGAVYNINLQSILGTALFLGMAIIGIVFLFYEDYYLNPDHGP